MIKDDFENTLILIKKLFLPVNSLSFNSFWMKREKRSQEMESQDRSRSRFPGKLHGIQGIRSIVRGLADNTRNLGQV